MTEREEIPEDVMKLAMDAQDEAEAHCKEQKYVYGFGSGNAKMVLDHYIAKALLQARSQAFEESAKIADCGCNNPGCERDEIAQAIRQHSQKGRDTE